MKLVVIDPAVPQARRWRWTVLACRLAEAYHNGQSIADFVASEAARATANGTRAVTRQTIYRLQARSDFAAKVEQEMDRLRRDDDIVRRGVKRRVEGEAVYAIRHQMRREIATDDGDVTSAARLAFEYTGAIGKGSGVVVDNRTQSLHLDALPTPVLLREWRASLDAAERELTPPPDASEDAEREVPSSDEPSEENPSDEDRPA